jgi:hypothetical protein
MVQVTGPEVDRGHVVALPLTTTYYLPAEDDDLHIAAKLLKLVLFLKDKVI